MRTLFVKEVSVKMTTDEVAEINELIKKSKPMPVIHKESYDLCPTCKSVLLDNCKYCRDCGQAVDITNYQL